MLAVAFDTLKLACKLESAGMPPKQAQEASAALSESFVEWLAIGNTPEMGKGRRRNGCPSLWKRRCQEPPEWSGCPSTKLKLTSYLLLSDS